MFSLLLACDRDNEFEDVACYIVLAHALHGVQYTAEECADKRDGIQKACCGATAPLHRCDVCEEGQILANP
jgi:hypothetical protein